HMPEHNEGSEDKELQAPEALVSALARVSQDNIFVPRSVDDAVLREARRHLAKPERRGFTWRNWLPRFATAAVLVGLLTYLFVRHGTHPLPPAFALEDVNHD